MGHDQAGAQPCRLPEIRDPADRGADHALTGIPPEKVRYHWCWGSWHGAHVNDIPLEHIIDIALRVKAQTYSFEAANVRHQHEMGVWKEVKLAPGTILMPGVISHATNIVEHPELIARRLVHWGGRCRARECGGRSRLRHGRPGACGDWLVETRRACRRGGSRDENLAELTGNHLVSALHRVPCEREYLFGELGADADPFMLHLYAALAEKERVHLIPSSASY